MGPIAHSFSFVQAAKELPLGSLPYLLRFLVFVQSHTFSLALKFPRHLLLSEATTKCGARGL